MNLADLFTLSTLTVAINVLPAPPTMLGSSGLFKPKRVNTTTVTIESINGRLVLVENTNRNGDPSFKKNPKAVRRTFEIPHLPKQGQILPTELEVAAFGESDKPKEQSKVINDKLQGLKNDIETTLEYHRVGAISGIILDADGTTPIYNLYTEFGVTEKNINIALSNSGTDVRKFLLDAKRHAQKQLGGSLITGWTCYCSAEFFDKFTGHDQVKAPFANYQAAADRNAGDNRAGFVFVGITFIEYEVEVINSTGGVTQFIPDDTARLVPTATDLFQTYYAPANYNETAGTLGQPMYAKAQERSLGKGWTLEAQSNPLSVCTAPGALVKLTAT